MVKISDQGGFHVFIYPREHGVAHVHVAGPDFSASVAIESATILDGHIPSPHRRRALEWITENRDMLLTRWVEITGL